MGGVPVAAKPNRSDTPLNVRVSQQLKQFLTDMVRDQEIKLTEMVEAACWEHLGVHPDFDEQELEQATAVVYQALYDGDSPVDALLEWFPNERRKASLHDLMQFAIGRVDIDRIVNKRAQAGAVAWQQSRQEPSSYQHWRKVLEHVPAHVREEGLLMLELDKRFEAKLRLDSWEPDDSGVRNWCLNWVMTETVINMATTNHTDHALRAFARLAKANYLRYQENDEEPNCYRWYS